MKIQEVKIHNFRSVIDADIEVKDYMLFVGANNAGKSNIINALRVFYDDEKWSSEDFPKCETNDNESWVQITFQLNKEEWDNLADDYKNASIARTLTLIRYFKADDKNKVQKDQSNIYPVVNGNISSVLFYGAKNVSTAKIGQVLYVPAMTTTEEQTKMSGPSPLRNMLNFLLKKVVSKSETYQEITAAFDKLNIEARNSDGFLSAIADPINKSLSRWDVKFELSVNSVMPEEISKSLIKFSFLDNYLGIGLKLDCYGHGFQRSVIYELIRLAATFKEEKKSEKKEFSPSFTLILFEEPEAFLHPNQQENMAYQLRCIAAEEGQQVIITTHSPIFVGKAAENMVQIIRTQRTSGFTQTFQLKGDKINKIFDQGEDLLQALQAFVDDPKIQESQKIKARSMISSPPHTDIAKQQEKFRFQCWLDSKRAELFFADKVLLVEGTTERVLFNYLLANDWHELSVHHICVVDVLGKYNFHRYMGLLEAYSIPHGVMLDSDNDKEHQGAINDLVKNSKNHYTLAEPVIFPDCLEIFLGLSKNNRPDMKPLEILKAITSGNIASDKLDALRVEFCKALSIS